MVPAAAGLPQAAARCVLTQRGGGRRRVALAPASGGRWGGGPAVEGHRGAQGGLTVRSDGTMSAHSSRLIIAKLAMKAAHLRRPAGTKGVGRREAGPCARPGPPGAALA